MHKGFKKDLTQAIDCVLARVGAMGGYCELCEEGVDDDTDEGCWIIPGGFEVANGSADIPGSQGTYVPETVELKAA